MEHCRRKDRISMLWLPLLAMGTGMALGTLGVLPVPPQVGGLLGRGHAVLSRPSSTSAAVGGVLAALEVVDLGDGVAYRWADILPSPGLALVVDATLCVRCAEPLIVKVVWDEAHRRSINAVAICFSGTPREAKAYLAGAGWNGRTYWAGPGSVRDLLAGQRPNEVRALLVMMSTRGHIADCYVFREAQEARL